MDIDEVTPTTNKFLRDCERGHLPTVISLKDILEIVSTLNPSYQNLSTDDLSGIYYVIDI